eukprot:2233931-Rhodomonas_salina.3
MRRFALRGATPLPDPPRARKDAPPPACEVRRRDMARFRPVEYDKGLRSGAVEPDLEVGHEMSELSGIERAALIQVEQAEQLGWYQ